MSKVYVQKNDGKIYTFQIQQEDINCQGKWIKSLLRKCEDKREWEAVQDLEERWHKIRLRVLEWQYFLEGLTWTGSPNEVREVHYLAYRASVPPLLSETKNTSLPRFPLLMLTQSVI